MESVAENQLWFPLLFHPAALCEKVAEGAVLEICYMPADIKLSIRILLEEARTL